MANTTSHDLTTFTLIKFFFFNFINDSFDSVAYLTALWKSCFHETLSRKCIINVFKFRLVVTLRNYVSLLDTQ